MSDKNTPSPAGQLPPTSSFLDDPGYIDLGSVALLVSAAQSGDYVAAQRLLSDPLQADKKTALDVNASIPDGRSVGGYTAAMAVMASSVQSGSLHRVPERVAILNLLHAQGANFNQGDEHGWTLLHRAAYVAAQTGVLPKQLVAAALDLGADPKIKTLSFHHTPAELAQAAVGSKSVSGRGWAARDRSAKDFSKFVAEYVPSRPSADSGLSPMTPTEMKAATPKTAPLIPQV